MKIDSEIQFDSDKRVLICRGDWNLAHLVQLKSMLAQIIFPREGDLTIDGSSVMRMDTAGAWLLIELKNKLSQQGLTIVWSHFPDKSRSLLAIIENQLKEGIKLPISQKLSFLATVGKNTINRLKELQLYLEFIGGLTYETLRLILKPSHWRLAELANVIYRTGYQGLPIIALLSFLIGVVLTYQMGLQLKNYGANIYIVDLLGMSVLREFAPLITAIMISGRTGSAYTASIGMMKLNQEIDALNTLGVTPGELLILPRIIGLLISLPLLTMWSDIFGVVGGMVMSNNMLGITWYEFLQRFAVQIPLRSFLIGIGKAPVFALIIASIGCFEGMQVKNSADSVGQNTTRSVVLAIFFIIVADAVFSILFSKMKL